MHIPGRDHTSIEVTAIGWPVLASKVESIAVWISQITGLASTMSAYGHPET